MNGAEDRTCRLAGGGGRSPGRTRSRALARVGARPWRRMSRIRAGATLPRNASRCGTAACHARCGARHCAAPREFARIGRIRASRRAVRCRRPRSRLPSAAAHLDLRINSRRRRRVAMGGRHRRPRAAAWGRAWAGRGPFAVLSPLADSAVPIATCIRISDARAAIAARAPRDSKKQRAARRQHGYHSTLPTIARPPHAALTTRYP